MNFQVHCLLLQWASGNYCYELNEAYDFQQPTLDLNVYLLAISLSESSMIARTSMVGMAISA